MLGNFFLLIHDDADDDGDGLVVFPMHSTAAAALYWQTTKRTRAHSDSLDHGTYYYCLGHLKRNVNILYSCGIILYS